MVWGGAIARKEMGVNIIRVSESKDGALSFHQTGDTRDPTGDAL